MHPCPGERLSFEIKCTVLQVEDEWLKVVERDKKGRENIRLLRTENIKEVQEIV